MPSNLFEYHTMGLSPVGPEEAGGGDSCRFGGKVSQCSAYWFSNKCVVNSDDNGNITSVSCPPKTGTGGGGGGTGSSCNPSSIGKTFSFNLPSGKKWTLSKKDDARARAFYCGSGGGGGGGTGGTGGTGPIMDAIYCTGGEGAWDGKPTYWMNGRGAGCKTNDKGESMPYGRQITKEEYDLAGRVLCNDGTYQYQTRGIVDACHNHGGYPGTVLNPPTSTQNCPAPLGKEGLIQQAKQMALIDSMQERYGSMGQNSFKENFHYYENCPFYSELVTAYNLARLSAPSMPPIYQSR